MIHYRRRQRWIVRVVAAALVPPVLLAGASGLHSLNAARQLLDDDASLMLTQAERILSSANSTLLTLAGKVEPSCNDTTQDALRQAVYDTLYFREAGLVVGNLLVCTSTEVLTPPVPITEPEHRVPVDDSLFIAVPRSTLQPQPSIILLHRVDTDNAVNLLLNPMQFGESLQRRFTEASINARLERNDGNLLLEIGKALDADDRLQRRVDSAQFPLHVIASAPRRVLLQGSTRHMLLAGTFGLAVSAGLILLLQRRRQRTAPGDALREALDAGEFVVQYQPVMDAETLECVGAEALIRWQHPDRGLLLPGRFLPQAERAGLMLPITRWLMARIAEDMSEVLDQNPRFHISLNLNPGLLSDLSMPAAMMRALGPDVPPWRIIFEITEQQLISAGDGDIAVAVDALRETGALLALDDFGTGFASLKSLGDLPFDFLKIDKGLVATLTTLPATVELVSNIIDLSQRLNLKLVAEGVETGEQLEMLRALGVPLLQGWYFAPSLSAADFRQFVAASLTHTKPSPSES